MVALKKERGPNGLRLDQIIEPEVRELIPQSVGRTILPPRIDRHQGRVVVVPDSSLLWKGRSSVFNHLGSR